MCAVDSFASHVPFQKRNEHFEGLQIHIHYLSFSFHIFYIITIHTKKSRSSGITNSMLLCVL